MITGEDGQEYKLSDYQKCIDVHDDWGICYQWGLQIFGLFAWEGLFAGENYLLT